MYRRRQRILDQGNIYIRSKEGAAAFAINEPGERRRRVRRRSRKRLCARVMRFPSSSVEANLMATGPARENGPGAMLTGSKTTDANYLEPQSARYESQSWISFSST
jgi:hypothetical protein